MKRVTVLIDGFNLYHALDGDAKLKRCKWLNVKTLAQSLLKPDEELVDTVFFTTVATWSPEKEKRHRTYLRAVEWSSARVILGEFHKKTVRCKKCNALFTKYEEKRTDVNITVELLRQAHANTFDTAIIVSGDSDLMAAITLVRDQYPGKKLAVAIPPRRKAEQLKSVANFHIKIRRENIEHCLLPPVIDIQGSSKIVSPF